MIDILSTEYMVRYRKICTASQNLLWEGTVGVILNSVLPLILYKEK
jgi:hypothetical protein